MGSPTVHLEGYLDSFTGQGEAARLYLAALEAAGVPVAATSISIEEVAGGPAPDLARRAWKAPETPAGMNPNVNLVCVNGLELPRLVEARGPDHFAGRPTVGVWAWETDAIPAAMTESAHLLDEVWAYSTWVAENLTPSLSIPAGAVPLPIVAPAGEPGRIGVELPDAFVFLFIFDFLSTLERKNPLGLVDAFGRAFSPGEGPHLVLKTINGHLQPRAVEEVTDAIAGRPDIRVVDGTMTDGEKAALFEASDCYVSLHRSEGFGLPIGEAMALGKPAIATAYSGNLEFMTAENSYLVDHDLIDVAGGDHIYSSQGRWADPDLDHAAELMRRVAEDREGAREVGARGREHVATRFSPEVIGDIARDRLEALTR